MEPLPAGNDYNDLQTGLLRNIMLGIRKLREEMEAMYKKIGKLEDHRNTQHATHAWNDYHLEHLRTYDQERNQHTHVNEYMEN